MPKHPTLKLALVSHAGGHFEQLVNLKDLYDGYDHFWVTVRNRQTESVLQNEIAYYLDLAHFKRPWTYLSHFPQVFKIFKAEKPTHILSTGSGRTALVPFIVAKILGIRFIYIETFSRVSNLTLFGSFLMKLGHPVLTQWKTTHPGTSYIGPIFTNTNSRQENQLTEEHVFVTLGTRAEPFDRLLGGEGPVGSMPCYMV